MPVQPSGPQKPNTPNLTPSTLPSGIELIIGADKTARSMRAKAPKSRTASGVAGLNIILEIQWQKQTGRGESSQRHQDAAEMEVGSSSSVTPDAQFSVLIVSDGAIILREQEGRGGAQDEIVRNSTRGSRTTATLVDRFIGLRASREPESNRGPSELCGINLDPATRTIVRGGVIRGDGRGLQNSNTRREGRFPRGRGESKGE